MSPLEASVESAATAAPVGPPEAHQRPRMTRSGFCPEELNNSRQFSSQRTLGAAGARALDALLAELTDLEDRQRARSAAVEANLRTTLDAFLADLVTCAGKDGPRFLAYSRDRNDYVANRYLDAGITYRAAKDVVKFLCKANYVDHSIGYRLPAREDFPGAFGRRSRIRATAALVNRLGALGVSWADVQPRPKIELVRLKGPPETRGGTKPLIDYEDTPETIRMREELKATNALLARTAIVLPGPAPTLEVLDEDEIDEQPAPGQTWLYRVFNNGSFALGGRFYGGWWMALPKADRARLLLNGEGVVELDFVGLHPRLLYEQAGRPLPADVDPYALPGRLAAVPRDLVKRAFAQLLNATDGIRAPKGARARLPRRVSWAQVLDGLEQAHAPIAGWFRKGEGLKLQALDACIAASVLHRMTRRGVPCLPIHDSFIVPASQALALEEVMAASYRLHVRGNLDQGPSPIIRQANTSSPPIDGV